MPELGEKLPIREGEHIVPLIDEVQTALETIYVLPKRFRIANLLYPQASSPIARFKINNEGNNGLFVTDLDRLPPEIRLKRIDDKPNTLLGRLIGLGHKPSRSFPDIHPVLYFSDRIKKQLAEKPNITSLTDTRDLFQIVIEEISHAEYVGQQYETNGVVPGGIMAEAIAMLDIYTMYKIVCKQRGVPMSAKNNPLVNRVEHDMHAIMRTRKNKWILVKRKIAHKLSTLPPTQSAVHNAEAQAFTRSADDYIKSIDVIEGYLRHVMDSERNGEDVSKEVGQFYLMATKDQFAYLKGIYSGFKDKEYLHKLEAAAKDELEFTING